MAEANRKSRCGVRRIVSGGQTGVDRVALDVAIALGIPHGGWCPAGRLAEDGRIPKKYRLLETDSSDYAQRTLRNVVDSDGTLILCRGTPKGGTHLTKQLARRHGKPCLVVDLDCPVDADVVQEWLEAHAIHTLNVAGPRASSCPGIDSDAKPYLRLILS